MATLSPDVKLIVGPEKIEILAFSQVLANASPVFRRMLQPNLFSEGTNRQAHSCADINLLEHDADAMTLLCNILHHRTDKVLREDITPNDMANLATLLDYYDCAGAVQPWPQIWFTQPLIKAELQKSDWPLSDIGKWIHMSVQFGYESEFTRFTSELLERTMAEDFRRRPLLWDLQKLSPKLQGKLSFSS